MSNLTVRILSAVVLILGGFSALLFNLRSRWVTLALIVVLGAWELARLVDRKFASTGSTSSPQAGSAQHTAPNFAWLAALSALGFSLPYFPGSTLPASWVWIVAVVSLAGYILLGFRHLDIEVMAPWILMNAFVCAYMGLWATRLFALTGPETTWSGIGPLTFTIACIAAADTGAYAAGRAFGKSKLAPRISGKKTVAGAIGGVLITMVVAELLGPKLAGLHTLQALFLGAVLALTSIVGDLFISVLKRYAGAKDTSNLIPGHGGIMDRFDALVFAAPIAWVGLKLLS